ncbi:MAG: phosphate ABC transporter ATP-binding protein PstB [bacterium]
MAIIEVNDLNLYYGNFQALRGINLSIKENKITALIGPSGCGKSTLLRTFNRMNDLIEGVVITGKALIDGEDIYHPKTDLIKLRKKVGMVFQRPNPFPFSIFENILFGMKVHNVQPDNGFEVVVESCLREVLLWDDLKDKLHTSALKLSLEQQQRLCIARLLPVKPEILLMDEPCSALDPMATQRIEELMQEMKKEYTIVIVTHNMQQAARISEETGFMLLGELIEFSDTATIFTRPKDKRTQDYITGRFG